MNYIIQQGKKDAPVLVLLHGTGGTEESLIDVGKDLNQEATLIGIRGAILENGYPRFFRRLEEGVFDEKDLAERSKELDDFIKELANTHDFSLEQVVLVGYSNGANIGMRLLLDHPETYQTAVLFHPMYPVEVTNHLDLKETQVFVTMGTQDPIVSLADSQRVLSLLRERGASLTEEWTKSHQLTFLEVSRAKEWLGNVGN